MTSKEINEYVHKLEIIWYAENRPNIPEQVIPRKVYNCKKANSLTKAVMDTTKWLGGIADRRSSEGRYRAGESYKVGNTTHQGEGTWLPGVNKGIADIELAFPGRMIFVEIKIGADRQSDVQKQFQRKVEMSGNEYYIVKTFDDFIEQIVQLV